MKLNPYIVFDGTALEAADLYQKAFGGTTQIMKFKDAPANPDYPMSEEYLEKVMHGEVRFGDNSILMCDDSPFSNLKNGNRVQLTITFFEDEAFYQALDVFKPVSQMVVQPEKTFFAKQYTCFEDPFGVAWQLILNEKEV